MSSLEWCRYLHETVGLREPPEVINDEVVRRMLARYETDLPVVPGAVEAVWRLAALESARRLGVVPGRCVAVEDSASGIRAAHAAGTQVLAYPNRDFLHRRPCLALADVVIASMAELAAALRIET
jgi:hypothetical protein